MNLKKEIDEYLKSQRLMAVATYEEEPWIANVYYIHDKDLNLYFLSKNWREHCQAIEKNNKVSVAIADSHQPIYKPQKGLQIYGAANTVNIITQLSWMFKMWNKLISGSKGEKLTDPKKFLDAGTSTIYKITPKRIKFFNTELWPKEQFRVLEF
ncbi:MAG: pyridoxamine 5'-phosphate oxidase family protein [bacterium]|nr:pyridoxamine 5'-phosphate oxidase family protein [bacterium]